MLKLDSSPHKKPAPKPGGLGTKFSSRAFLEKMFPWEKAKAIQELTEKIKGIEDRLILLRQTSGTNPRTTGLLKSMKSACERDLKTVQNAKPVNVTDEGIFKGNDITITDYSNWQKTGSKKH